MIATGNIDNSLIITNVDDGREIVKDQLEKNISLKDGGT